VCLTESISTHWNRASYGISDHLIGLYSKGSLGGMPLPDVRPTCQAGCGGHAAKVLGTAHMIQAKQVDALHLTCPRRVNSSSHSECKNIGNTSTCLARCFLSPISAHAFAAQQSSERIVTACACISHASDTPTDRMPQELALVPGVQPATKYTSACMIRHATAQHQSLLAV